MSQTYPLRWYERFQFEFVIHFNLVPNREMTWKSWAFDPSYGITLLGQEITDRYQLPKSYAYGVDYSQNIKQDEKKYTSLIFWIRGAVRIFGLDIGAGFFYRKQAKAIPILVSSND